MSKRFANSRGADRKTTMHADATLYSALAICASLALKHSCQLSCSLTSLYVQSGIPTCTEDLSQQHILIEG